MRIHLGRYAMRGGKQDDRHPTKSGVLLAKKNGELNLAQLVREIQEACDLVADDTGTPSMVQRIEIQIQR